MGIHVAAAMESATIPQNLVRKVMYMVHAGPRFSNFLTAYRINLVLIACKRKCAYELDKIVSMKIRQMLILSLLTFVFRRVITSIEYFQPPKSPVSTFSW